MLGSLIIFLKGMRRMMFQLSGFYYRSLEVGAKELNLPGMYIRCRGSGERMKDCGANLLRVDTSSDVRNTSRRGEAGIKTLRSSGSVLKDFRV